MYALKNLKNVLRKLKMNEMLQEVCVACMVSILRPLGAWRGQTGSVQNRKGNLSQVLIGD